LIDPLSPAELQEMEADIPALMELEDGTTLITLRPRDLHAKR
jgi:hypothetical protein